MAPHKRRLVGEHMKVVAAVVGYKQDLLHPFAIGTSHGSARNLLRMLKDEYEFHAN